jgi:hypothetical protein
MLPPNDAKNSTFNEHFMKSPGKARFVIPTISLLRREADHTLPSSVEMKNARSYTSTPQYVYVFTAWCLIKHGIYLHGVVFIEAQGQLYFYLSRESVYNTHPVHIQLFLKGTHV